MLGLLLAAAAASSDPCALLTKEEIRKVQGEEVQLAKPAPPQPSGDVEVAQCFFQLPTFTKSISLEVTRGKGVAKLWRASFHAAEKDDEDEEASKPERVRGLGDEAFWTGSARLGGLYVLRKGAMLRLSVGGAEAKGPKLKKLRALAASALKRL